MIFNLSTEEADVVIDLLRDGPAWAENDGWSEDEIAALESAYAKMRQTWNAEVGDVL